MRAPIAAVDTCILDWVSAMYHHTVTDINTNVRYRTSAVVCAREANYISRFCFRRSYRGTLIENALCSSTGQRIYAGIFEYPAYKAGTIERG